MNIVLSETELYTGLGVLGISILINFLGMMWASNYFFSVAKMKILKQPMALVGTIKGEAEFRNYKYEAGWLRGKEADYQITERSISKTKNNNYLFILHENLGLTLPLEVGSAITALVRMGYKDLPSAVGEYDNLWLAANEKELNKALEEQNKNQDKENLQVKKIIAAGRNALLKLEWPNNYTIPLSIVHGWAWQAASAFNNKVIVQRAEINMMKKMLSGVNVTKVATLIIAGAIGLAIILTIAMVYQQGVAGTNIVIPDITQGIQQVKPPGN